jgi:hypothetical protein
MTLGAFLDPDPGKELTQEFPGQRPLLSRAQMLGMRVLMTVSAPIYLVLLAMNVRSVGDAVFRLSSLHMWIALTFGIMVVILVSTYAVLLGVGLYHFVKGHKGPRPAAWWPWAMVILNVPGAAAYYLCIIEPEQRAQGQVGPASPGSGGQG